MSTWFPENGPRTKVEGFVSNRSDWSRLIGKKIRIRWPDVWGDAFYVGHLSILGPMEVHTDVPESLAVTLLDEAGEFKTLVIPTGKDDLEVWMLP